MVLHECPSFHLVWVGCRGEELLELIAKPTAKETAVVKRFKTEGGSNIREYCPHLTKDDCCRHATFLLLSPLIDLLKC